MTVNVNVIDQAIQGRDGYSPYIGDGNYWYVYDNDSREWVNTGIFAGNGPTISGCYVNADKSITFYFSDGTSYTTPSLKGYDANTIIYWIWPSGYRVSEVVAEGYDSDLVYHAGSTLNLVLISSQFSSVPQIGDFIIDRNGVIWYCTGRDTIEDALGTQHAGFQATCIANLNPSAIIGTTFTTNQLYVNEFANIVGLTFREVDVNGVTHLRLE